MGVLTKPYGPEILDQTRDFIRRFCVFPSAAELNAVTLWTAHTHLADQFYSSPRLALLSPEPASGKTRVLEVLDLLVSDPMQVLNASPATIFRTLAKHPITLLIDEVDAIWRSRGRDDAKEDLRALLNAGHRKGATIPRCDGPRHEVEYFPVFCPVALAGLGELPETIMSRSVIIRMRPRAPNEKAEPFRDRLHEDQGHSLRDRLAIWAKSVEKIIADAWPDMPAGIEDRPADIWEPLLAIADAAGGHWPITAREACVILCDAATDRRVSLGIRLLSDLRTIFGEADSKTTETIIEQLTNGVGLEPDAPWGDLRGKPINSRSLASILRPYGIRSRKIRDGVGTLQGYRREDLFDSWQRYLPKPTADTGEVEHPEQAEQSKPVTYSDVPDVLDVPVNSEPA